MSPGVRITYSLANDEDLRSVRVVGPKAPLGGGCLPRIALASGPRPLFFVAVCAAPLACIADHRRRLPTSQATGRRHQRPDEETIPA